MTPPRRTWLVLLFALPARKGASRVSVWRQLKKAGAIALKTSAYVLPDQPSHRERFQWLAQQVRDGGGRANVMEATHIEGATDEEIVGLFNAARAEEYAALAADMEKFIAAHRGRPGDTFAADLERLSARFEEISRIDFFGAPRAEEARMQLERARTLHTRQDAAPQIHSTRRFRGRTWLTRPRPEIDRVGSAWLIRRFIDPDARFVFASQPDAHPGAVPYDMLGVEFTHHGDDCTFETLVKRFGIDDPAVQRLAEMVHAADLEDGKFARMECVGIDRVLKGWGRLGWSDQKLLERGGECFDALYELLRKHP